MKKRTAFIGAILSLIPFGQPLLIKTGVILSSAAVMLTLPEIVNANDADYYFDLARYNFNKGKFNEVILNLNTAIKINPNFAAAYLARCGTKVNIQEYEEAITDCEKAFHLNLQDSNNYIDKKAVISKEGLVPDLDIYPWLLNKFSIFNINKKLHPESFSK